MTESLPTPDHRRFESPLDQQPVDQQPVPPRQPAGSDAPQLPSHPRLPGAGPTPPGPDRPAMVARPVSAPLIPPLETTSPVDFVEADSSPRVGPVVRPLVQTSAETSEFEPLRVDPPPSLVPTWWLRWTLLAVMSAAPAVVLWVEYHGAPGDVRSSTPVIALHVSIVALIAIWSFFAMGNTARMVPPSRYTSGSRGSVAVLLWALAGAAPIGVLAASHRLSGRLDDSDDLAAVFSMIAIVMIAFLVTWLPFRYHARQATRVGAPHRAMTTWFFAPMIAAVGGVVAVAVWLGDMLAEDGLTATERVIQIAVPYALPMAVFALSTWRAVTVFDEVIDLRWQRWRTEWEQTLGRLADEPPPGPEDSPSIDGLFNR